MVKKTTKNQKRSDKNKTEVKRKKKKNTNKYKIEAKPLTEEQIRFFVDYYKENKAFPGSKIPCSITGKLTTCVGPWMVKKIKEFGGPENLLRKYTCRGALKAKREASKPVSKNKKRRQLLKDIKIEEKVWDLPKINFTPPQPLTPQEIASCTKGACLRPDIYLDNDRYCDGCEFYNVCASSLKALLGTKIKKKQKLVVKK